MRLNDILATQLILLIGHSTRNRDEELIHILSTDSIDEKDDTKTWFESSVNKFQFLIKSEYAQGYYSLKMVATMVTICTCKARRGAWES